MKMVKFTSGIGSCVCKGFNEGYYGIFCDL